MKIASLEVDPLVHEQLKLIGMRKIAERLLVLATKHCPRGHHDWKEILEIAAKLDEEHE